MCGIVGLFIKDKALEPQLGQLLPVMLATMCDRGPDSAGFAVYGGGEAGLAKITVQSPDPTIFNGLDAALAGLLGAKASMTTKDTHAVLRLDEKLTDRAREVLRGQFPQLRVMGVGERIEIYKEVGYPTEVSERFGLAGHDRHAWHRPHPHGDRIRGHHAWAPIRSRPAPTSVSCTTARCRTTTICAATSSATAWPSRPRTIPRSPPPISPAQMDQGLEPRRRAGKEPRRSRRLLHLRRRHQRRFRRAARSDRLQAGGDGRDRPLRRVRLRISRAGRSARHRERQGLGARTRDRLFLGAR